MMRAATLKRIVLTGLFLWPVVSPAANVTVDWSAFNLTGVALEGTTNGLPPGSLLEIGTFTNGAPTVGSSSLTGFAVFATGQAGSNSMFDGFWSIGSTAPEPTVPHQQIYLVAFNAPSAGAATQLGIFSSTEPNWFFKISSDIPNSTFIDIEDLIDNPGTSSNALKGTAQIIFGSGPVFDPTAGGETWLRLKTFVPIADILQYSALKGRTFAQTDAGAPLASAFEFFSFVDAITTGRVSAASVQSPDTVVHTLSNTLSDLRFQFTDSFTNQTLLDAAYSNATYQFTIIATNGTQSPSITLTNDNYPAAPHIANWSAAQSIDPTTAFTFLWDAFTGGTSTDLIQFAIADLAGSNVFTTSSDFRDASRLTGTNTSALIPAGTLAAGQTYQAELMFVKVTALDTNAVFSAAGIAGFFAATDFDIVVPTPATVQFSAAAFTASESSGTATITVTRAGNSATTVTVNHNFGVLTFTNGQTTATFLVPIVDDGVLEGNKTVNLTLSNPTGGNLGSPSVAVLTIADNDSTPGAVRLDFLQTELADLLECIANVSLTLLSSDRPGAAAEITNCVTIAQQLLADAQAPATSDALGAKAAGSLQKQFASVLKKLLAAQTALNDSSKPDEKALAALIKASGQITKGKKTFFKFTAETPVIVLEELKGKGGFHGVNELVCYRIHILDLANGANCGPGTVIVTNLPASVGLNVVNTSTITPTGTDFCLTSGADQGAARISVTACDRTNSLILINRGP